MKDILEFYANKDNWKKDYSGMSSMALQIDGARPSEVEKDRGKKAREALLELKKKENHPSYVPPDRWFTYDGDVVGLREIIDNVEWDCFNKIGKDRNGNFLLFLIADDKVTYAIKCTSNKKYQEAMAVLRE